MGQPTPYDALKRTHHFYDIPAKNAKTQSNCEELSKKKNSD